MVQKPFFSIILPTYNRSSDLQFAMYCLLRQSFSDFEIIISDNCSTDNTHKIINTIKDKRIRYYRNKKNIGVTLNYRKAITHAKGYYVFLHSDDDFLLYRNSLRDIYKKIQKYKPGYIRVNYICQAPDKKRIFDFTINKFFTKDQYIPPLSKNVKVMQFIIDSDAAFVTGLIYKNSFPKSIEIVDAQPMSWIEILFYVTKNYGGYFMSKPYIIASWSPLRIQKNDYNVQYSLINGKLASENYLNVVKKYLDRKTYEKFLHNQLMTIYVYRFSLVKLYTGNKNLQQVSARIRSVDPVMVKNIVYWIYYILALILPRNFIPVIKNVYLFIYMQFATVKNNHRIMTRMAKMKKDYSKFIV